MRTSYKLPIRWLLLAVLLALAWVIPMHAQRVSPEDAERAALTFLQACSSRCNNTTELTDVSEALGFGHLYAFTGEKGYVVLAADNRVSPVLCFSEEGHIDAAHLPEGMRVWLNHYENQIQYISEHRLVLEENATQQWEDLINGNDEELVTRESIGPLISTDWGDDSPYNSQCPINQETGYQCTTGSVATTMAQVLKYWEHPQQGKGHITYTELNGYGSLTANYGETVYDWEHMLFHYVLGLPNEVEINAVATLMSHCGIGVRMRYDYDRWISGHNGSSCTLSDFDNFVQEVLVNHLYYKCPAAIIKDGTNSYLPYSDEQWVQMIKDALSSNPPRPILYAAKDTGTPNAQGMVCDGYRKINDVDFIHIKTESTFCDSWCRVNEMYLLPQGGYYDLDQRAYFGIEPDSATITVNVSQWPTWGTVTGAGKHPKGNTITLHAEPVTGTHFSRWTTTNELGNTIVLSSSPELSVKVENDETYTAVFERDQCVITTEIQPAGAGVATGGGTYNYGEYCYLMAEANPGYAFVGWYDGEIRISYEPDLQLCVGYNRTLTARFEVMNYTVTLFPVPFIFSGTVSGGGDYPANTSVTVTASPAANHQFLGWVENGAVVSSNSSYTFTLQRDRNLLAVFGNLSQSGIGSVVTNADGSQGVLFHIDPSGEGWMVAMDDASEGCAWGPETNIDALADYPCNNVIAMKDLSGFMNTGLIRTELGTENDYAASQVDFEHGWYLPSAGQLRKLYSALPFIDSVLYQHGGSTISEDAYWSSTEYSASDAASPMFAMNNANKGSNLRVRAIRNYFSPQDNMILAMPDSPSRGTVTVYNQGVYSYGANAAVMASPKTGYVFDHWSEDGLPVSYDHIYTFTFTHSRKLVAHFVVSGSVGTVVHNADGSDGVVFYMSPDGTEGLMVALEDASEGCPWGPTVNIDALPDYPCNNFLALDDMSGFQNTGVLRNAQGVDSLYAANVVDYANGWYLPSAGQLRKLYAALPMIESALVRAGGTPLRDEAYWSSTEYSSTDAHSPMFAMSNSNKGVLLRVRAVRSFLASGTHSLLAKSNDTLMGTVTGSGVYELNAMVTVSAHAKLGYVFDHWSEEGALVSSDAQYSFPFTRNRTLVANFIVAGSVGSIVHNADGSKGVVFYLNQEGTEGWMVALNDDSEGCAWGPTVNINALPDYPCNNFLALDDLSGYANTNLIRSKQGTNNGYAASVVDYDNGWYLPSAGQLRKLYAALPMIEQSLLESGGSVLTGDAYWSSTEYSSSDALSPSFSMSNSNKGALLRVRAVRSFNTAGVNSVRLLANNLTFGSAVGSGTYQYGATVRVIATPNAGYSFDHWEEDGCTVSYDRYYTFEFTRTRTLVAVFVRENSIGSIVHNADGSTGVIFYTYPSGIGGLMVALEDDSEGCPWGLNEDVAILDNQSPSAVMDLLEDMRGKSNTNRVRQWYSDNSEYAACKTDYANGWYLPSAGQLRKLYAALPIIEGAIVNAGGTTLTEDAYWSSTEQSASNAWTPSFAMSSSSKTGNCRVRAIRSLTDTETITANVNIEGSGIVTGAGWYDHGQTCTLKAQANESYAFLNWTHGGTVVSTKMEYSFTVLGNQTYTANFVANSSNITTAIEPANSGTLTGAGIYTIGSNCTLTATPITGYSFVNWTKNGNVVSTNSSYSFTVMEQAQYTAHFVINSYAVNATAFPEEGGTVSGAHAYTHGSTATLTATAAEGYTFINWTENGAVVSTSPTLQFVVYGNRTLVANFSANIYSVIAVALPSDGGTIEGDGDYAYGTTATLTAHSNLQFDFFCWFENDDVLSFDPSVSFEVTEDRVIYAVFVENESVTQTVTLSQGPNWFSTYLEITKEDLQNALLDVLSNPTGAIIKSQDGNSTYRGGRWRDQNFVWDVAKMYMIVAPEDCVITLTGMPINPADHPITIAPNAPTWIGFPFAESKTPALVIPAGFAVNGDIIKGMGGNIRYNNGSWRAQGMNILEPGKGYIYNSKSAVSRTLVFPTSAK